MADKLKRELENSDKVKKFNSELSVAKATMESALSDLNDKLAALSEDRNLLERELAKQQSQLQLERNQRNEASTHSQELEARVTALLKEASVHQEQKQAAEREGAELGAKVVDLEKSLANMEVELKGALSRYDSMVANNNSSNSNNISNVSNSGLPAAGGSMASKQQEQQEQLLKKLEAQLGDEVSNRQRVEGCLAERERELSLLTVDFRQTSYRLEKLEADLRAETEKARGASLISERLREEKSLMQSDLTLQASEVTLLKTNEKRMARDLAEVRERAKSLEEELHKVRAARSVDDLQRKELEDQLETEQYFSTLYKTQVRELQDEADEARDRSAELERDREALGQRVQQSSARADGEALARRVLEEDLAELEKEKMMVELELEELSSKHKADARNLEMQLAAAKDIESDLLQRVDQLSKDNEELSLKAQSLQDELDAHQERSGHGQVVAGQGLQEQQEQEVVRLQKLLQTEKVLKQQAVNKLAEIMNRKDFGIGKRDKKAESKAAVAELRKKDKENRRLEQELNMEKDKYNRMVAKFAKEQQDLHATLYEESQTRIKLSMELATKESDLEQLQVKLAQMNLDTASLSSGLGGGDIGGVGCGDPSSMDGMGYGLGEISAGLEGWLQIPLKQNIRRHGWRKTFVVVSSKKIIFFNSEADRQNADPTLVIDLK